MCTYPGIGAQKCCNYRLTTPGRNATTAATHPKPDWADRSFVRSNFTVDSRVALVSAAARLIKTNAPAF